MNKKKREKFTKAVVIVVLAAVSVSILAQGIALMFY